MALLAVWPSKRGGMVGGVEESESVAGGMVTLHVKAEQGWKKDFKTTLTCLIGVGAHKINFIF